jgi:hypothetical protein
MSTFLAFISPPLDFMFTLSCYPFSFFFGLISPHFSAFFHTPPRPKLKPLLTRADQVENSRPNSIYNLSGPPTDIEASRPQSALTSYSNFHGQRRPTGGGNMAAGRPNVTNLTQESLLSVSFKFLFQRFFLGYDTVRVGAVVRMAWG